MNKLHRSKKNRVIAGVCGGLAEYFQFDPTLIRIIFILIAIPGPGLLMYLVAGLIMPGDDREFTNESQWSSDFGDNSHSRDGFASNAGKGAEEDSIFEDEFKNDAAEWNHSSKDSSKNNKLVLGAILVGLGVLFLAKQIMPQLFELKFLIPILLIGIGGVIVFKGRK